MKKKEKSNSSSSMGTGKPAAEKRKKDSHRIRIGMDFDSKISKLHNQEVVDKYLAKYGFRLNPRIKVEFCPMVLTFLRLRLMMVYMCILRTWR